MVEDGRPQGADTPPRFDAMREAQRYIAALQDEVDRLRAALASGGTAPPTDELIRAAWDLVEHTDRMLKYWAEMAPREGMSAEEHEEAMRNRARVLWTPLHRKADALHAALAARTPQPAPTDEPHCRLCGRFRSPWHDADGPRMRDPHPFTPAPDGEETPDA